jgi:hypothetical protein
MELSRRQKTLLAAGLTLALTLSYCAWHSTWLPPLARDLPANIEQAEAVFRDRVRGKFSPGMDESKLIYELKSQGFGSPIGPLHQYKDVKYVQFSKGSFVCDVRWTILWHVDQNGKIADVDATHNATCL